MTIKVSLSVSLDSIVARGDGNFRVSFNCDSDCWADAVLSVSSTDATIVACEPTAVTKGKHSVSGQVDISHRTRSLVGLSFRLEVPGGGGMDTVVRHAQTGAT